MTTVVLPNETARQSMGLYDYVSPSRLNTWLTCPLKFKFHYIDGIKEPASPSLFLGKQIHAGLQHFYLHRQSGIELDVSLVIEHMQATWDEAVSRDHVTFESAEQEKALKQQAAALVETYIKQRSCDESLPLATEVPLECPLIDPETNEDLGISLFGIVDLVLDAPDGPLVVDFKSSAKSSAPLEVTHEIQLSCYSYLVRHALGRAESELQIRSLIKTKTPKVQTHRYPARRACHFRRLLAVVRAYLDDLRNERFVFRPNWLCSTCAYCENQCSDWQADAMQPPF